MTDTIEKLYGDRDPIAQGAHYLRHMNAMTAEGLHSKSRIAEELAHRDIEIERLTAALKPDEGLLERAEEWLQSGESLSQTTELVSTVRLIRDLAAAIRGSK